MNKHELIKSMVDKNNNKKIYYKLAEFNINGYEEDYLLYTDYSKKDGKIKIYYGVLKSDEINKVKDNEVKKIIQEYINKINFDMLSGINF